MTPRWETGARRLVAACRRGTLALLLLAAGGLGLSGCIYGRSGVERVEPPFQTGVTTRRDVVAEWGNPDAVFGETWVWRNREVIGGKLRASFMMIGATVSNLSRSVFEYRLAFGPDGRLKSLQAVEHFPGGDSWSINPWK